MPLIPTFEVPASGGGQGRAPTGFRGTAQSTARYPGLIPGEPTRPSRTTAGGAARLGRPRQLTGVGWQARNLAQPGQYQYLRPPIARPVALRIINTAPTAIKARPMYHSAGTQDTNPSITRTTPRMIGPVPSMPGSAPLAAPPPLIPGGGTPQPWFGRSEAKPHPYCDRGDPDRCTHQWSRQRCPPRPTSAEPAAVPSIGSPDLRP